MKLSFQVKSPVLFILLGFLFVFNSCRSDNDNKKVIQNKTINSKNTRFRNGDIIFHSSLSAQSMAIQLATRSKYSHCGIIYIENGQEYVFEAIQPVCKTELNRFIARGNKGHYVVKRLKNADKILTNEVLQKMKNEGNKHAGKNYDLTFEWSDGKMYCSEIVWKIYKRAANLEVGKLANLSDFDLSNPVVKKKLKERYGDNLPLNESVISPAAVFNSELLETVFTN